MIYQYQQETFNALKKTMRGFAEWDREPGLRPRFQRLVSGGSGSGKSFVVEHAAQECGFEVLHLQSTCWTIINGRSSKPTTSTIGSWVNGLESWGLLMIDELDKIYHHSEYSTALRGEIYTILDGWMPSEGVYESDEPHRLDHATLSKKLRRNVLIIGAGTWQDVQDNHKPSLGFSPQEREPMHSLNTLSKHIDRELLNRFHPQVLVLPDLSEDEYTQMAVDAVRHIPHELHPTFYIEAQKLLPSATRDKLNARFVETVLANTLMAI